MKVLSLFSGIGGFDLGLMRSGMEIVATCEIDKHCQKVLKTQFPNVPIYSDVKEIKFERHSVDLVCGGFPCQDLSVAGRRRGLDGERSGLWFEYQRIIDEIEPKWVIIENVPGLLYSAKGEDFTVIIRWLADRGYGVGWRVLDSQGFGLAQRRKRVFIVASFGSPRGCTLLLEPESLRWDSLPSKEEGEEHTRTIAKCLSTHGWRNDASVETYVEHVLWEASHGYDPARVSPDPELVPTLSAKMGTGGNNVPLVGLRRLTPIECERLQGFPDNWTAGNSDTQRYKQLGNAVSVPVIEWIGNKIMGVSNGQQG